MHQSNKKKSKNLKKQIRCCHHCRCTLLHAAATHALPAARTLRHRRRCRDHRATAIAAGSVERRKGIISFLRLWKESSAEKDPERERASAGPPSLLPPPTPPPLGFGGEIWKRGERGWVGRPWRCEERPAITPNGDEGWCIDNAMINETLTWPTQSVDTLPWPSMPDDVEKGGVARRDLDGRWEARRGGLGGRKGWDRERERERDAREKGGRPGKMDKDVWASGGDNDLQTKWIRMCGRVGSSAWLNS